MSTVPTSYMDISMLQGRPALIDLLIDLVLCECSGEALSRRGQHVVEECS